MSDKREVAATIFDRTAKLAGALASRASGDVGLALGIAAGISKAVAVIIRALGIEDAGKAIDELVARKNEGVIGDDDVAADDAEIASEVSDMFADDADDEGDEE